MKRDELKELIKQELQTINESSEDYMRAVVLWQLHYETRGNVKAEKIANAIFDSHEAKNAVKSMGMVPKDDIPAYYMKSMDNYSKSDKSGVLEIYKQAVAKLGYDWERKLREAFIQEKKHTKQEILKYLIKKGSNPKDAKKDVDKHYDYVSKKYKDAPLSKKAEVIVSLHEELLTEGYTLSWEHSEDFDNKEWSKIIKAAVATIKLAKSKGIEIAGPFGDGKPELTNLKIALNGSSEQNSDGQTADHESFVLYKKADDIGGFVKTARKPYDAVVATILAAAQKIAPKKFKPGGDGGLRGVRPGGMGKWKWLPDKVEEQQLTEKKTMDTKTIVKVAKYTDQNQHTLARFLVAKEARFSKLEKSYQLLYNLHEHIGHATQGLTTLRYEFDKELKSLLKKNYSNWLEIWNGL